MSLLFLLMPSEAALFWVFLLSWRLLPGGCWTAVRLCRGAGDMFKSESFASRQAERCEAVFPDRVQHEEELHGQAHLCPVRATISSVNNADCVQSTLSHGFCPHWSWASTLSPYRLFEWLVTLINNRVCADESAWTNFIGEGIFTPINVGHVELF